MFSVAVHLFEVIKSLFTNFSFDNILPMDILRVDIKNATCPVKNEARNFKT
jgi:hypothetical protein